MDTKERPRHTAGNRTPRQRQIFYCKIAIAALAALIAILCVLLSRGLIEEKTGPNSKKAKLAESERLAAQAQSEADLAKSQELLTQAETLSAMYDYDSAIELLKTAPGFESDLAMQAKATEIKSLKNNCVVYPLEEVTHVFYHSLIKDPKKAFRDGDQTSDGLNQVMTTIDEFNKITQSMYEKGYVMVSLDDMVTFDKDGNAIPGEIMLPADKKAFVLSQDDVSYYHYQQGYGLADKLILDENGEVKTTYTEDDGTVTIGNDDMVPLIDAFVKEHPDFSYRGAKGTLALTGYNGVLGYRTDIVYKTKGENLDANQQEWLDANPDFNYDEDVAAAAKVAEAMKANGWTFASHTWGHQYVGDLGLDDIKTDTKKWLDYVAPIVGPSNKIIFAFGQDIGPVDNYTTESTDGKFDYLKSVGFDIFCNVDSAQYWVQIGANYMRQGRRNLDGYRMDHNPDLLEDLFDAKAVLDKDRPLPVPEM